MGIQPCVGLLLQLVCACACSREKLPAEPISADYRSVDEKSCFKNYCREFESHRNEKLKCFIIVP